MPVQSINDFIDSLRFDFIVSLISSEINLIIRQGTPKHQTLPEVVGQSECHWDKSFRNFHTRSKQHQNASYQESFDTFLSPSPDPLAARNNNLNSEA